MTVVGGEPVEVQVKVDGEALPLNSRLVTCGVTAGADVLCIHVSQMKSIYEAIKNTSSTSGRSTW